MVPEVRLWEGGTFFSQAVLPSMGVLSAGMLGGKGFPDLDGVD